MSDTPQGEGWWQASDGRWYSPEQHPDAAAAQAAAPTPASTPTPTSPSTPASTTGAVPGESAAAASGAARAAGPAGAQQVPPVVGSAEAGASAPGADDIPGGAGATPPGGDDVAGTGDATGGGGSRRGVLVVALVVVVALLAGAVAFVLLGDDDDEVASGDGAAEDDAGDLTEFCGRMEDLGGGDLTFDEAELATLDQMAASAPPEIRDDMVLVVGVMHQVADAMTQAEEDGDHDALMETALEAAFGAFEDPEVLEANDRIEAFLSEECGIEPFDGSGESEGLAGGEDPDVGEPTVMGVAVSEVEAHFEQVTAQMGLEADYFSRIGTDRLSQVLLTIGGGDDDDVLDDMRAVCDDMSEFLADHPDADGTARIELMRSMSTLQVVNEDVAVGDAGDCVGGVNQPPSGGDFWEDQSFMGVPMSDVEAQFDVLLERHGLSWSGFGTYDDGSPQLELGVFLAGRDDDVVDDMLALCDDMSEFLADHPDAEGSGGVQVGDEFGSMVDMDPPGLLVVNDELEAGAVGTCEQQ